MSFSSVSSLSATLLLFFLCGCAPATRATNPDEDSVTNLQPTPSASGSFTSYSVDTGDIQKFSRLWLNRTQTGLILDYPLGPGDVIDISVPAMKELAQITVRVSAEGEISLPFIGVVKVNGLTEKKLSEELLRRLGENYMHNPQVNLYVREYRSRRVAILGAVANPGLYSLTKGTETLLDVISLAGGMTKEAAARIHLIPFEPVENGKPKENISDVLAEFVSKGSSPDILKGVDPIVIDLQSLINGGNQMYLGLPVRPGDVIVVPGSGEVLIDGWVEKPGSYKITPGLTVIGAVAAAGGVAFAADISSVKIIRTGRQGQKILVLADLEAINHGDNPDIPVQEGDVIKVPSSAPRLVGYGIYRFFSTAIHIGASVPLIK